MFVIVDVFPKLLYGIHDVDDVDGTLMHSETQLDIGSSERNHGERNGGTAWRNVRAICRWLNRKVDAQLQRFNY